MGQLIDFTNCEEIHNGYNGVNGAKKCIIYNDKIYLLKIPSVDNQTVL